MARAREAIAAGNFAAFAEDVTRRYRALTDDDSE
jgi:hypothetical protein